MNTRRATVQIIGAQVVCASEVKDSWREIAEWVAGQLAYRFGDAVQDEYFDLFDPSCPPLPKGAQLPVVIVKGKVISCGGNQETPGGIGIYPKRYKPQ